MRTAHKLTQCTIAVAVGTALALVAPAAQATYAGPATAAGARPDFDAHTLALMAAQQPLSAAVQRIESARGSGDHGFAGAAIDVQHHTITVYWHGSVPAAVEAQIDDARSQGIAVSVQPTAYSSAQLEAEMDRLLARSTAEANQRHTKPLIASVRMRDDYSGIDIGVTTDPAGPTPMLATARAELASSMPASTHHEDLAVPMATRQADTPPFYGAAAMESVTRGGVCTTGWAVRDSSQSYMLSAAHCGWDTWETYSKKYTLGRTSSISYSYDAQIIPTNSGARIYIGTSIADTSGSGQSTRPVVGVLPIAKGTQLCTDGALSGIQCSSITVTSPGRLSTAVLGADGIFRDASLWEAKSGTSNTIAGTGDSGGPVFGVTGTGGSEILAGGTIMGGTGALSMNCNGEPSSKVRECSTTIRFAAMSDELGALGVTLKT